jgi:hypothetical protein
VVAGKGWRYAPVGIKPQDDAMDDKAQGKLRWISIDPPAANALTRATNSPGQVIPMGTNQMPGPLHRMPGVISYHVSGYTTGVSLPGFTVGGEMLVARANQSSPITSNYLYAFGTSSDGQVCFAGPFRGIGHHVNSGQSIAVSALFGNTPFSNQGSGPL